MIMPSFSNCFAVTYSPSRRSAVTRRTGASEPITTPILDLLDQFVADHDRLLCADFVAKVS